MGTFFQLTFCPQDNQTRILLLPSEFSNSDCPKISCFSVGKVVHCLKMLPHLLPSSPEFSSNPKIDKRNPKILAARTAAVRDESFLILFSKGFRYSPHPKAFARIFLPGRPKFLEEIEKGAMNKAPL